MKKFTSVSDIDNVSEWVRKARDIKANPFAHKQKGENKTLGLLFFSPSLRTRMSTQKAAMNLGMDVIVVNINQEGWQVEMEDGTVMKHHTQEHIKELAGVVSQYCDIVGIRSFASLTDRAMDYADTVLKKFLQYIYIPIISLESAILHPLQSFADAITIAEHATTLKPKVVLSWVPHPRVLPQAVANSFAEWMAGTEVEFVITHPEGFDLAPQYAQHGQVLHDQTKAFENADFIYAKNWSSYSNYGGIGENQEHWMIDKAKMEVTNCAKFMHCLPVRRNVVVSDEVIDSDASLVLAQANNRTYAAQTVLSNMLKNV